MDIWQKLLLLISAIFFTTLFIENFIFSSSFATLQLREIDDVAFQHSIRNIHEDITALKFDGLIKLNDYGYGWIFWIIVGLLTYPFYLLALLTDFYIPLIAIPRDISLFFTIGTAWLVYKSLSVYSKNECLKFIAMIFLMSLPAFGYFALRFGTVAQVMFFSALTFYLTISKKNYEKRDLKYIAIAAAACVGTKLNGALILPLVGLIMAERMGWRINKENAKKAGYFLLIFFFCAVLFSNPALFLSPFKPAYLSNYIDSLKNNSHLSVENDLWKTVREVVEIGYLNLYLAVLALCLLILGAVGKNNKKDFLFMGVWLAFVLLFLSKVMSQGTLYIINYATVVFYLLVFSILYFERWKRSGSISAGLFLVLCISLNYTNFSSGFYSGLKYFSVQKNPGFEMLVAENKAMKAIIPDPKENPDKNINVLMDFRAIFPYAHLERKNLNVHFVFDNFQLFSKKIDGDFDYISLNKSSPFFLSDQKFSEFIADIKDEALLNNQVESRKIVQNLIKSGKFKNAKYQILLNSDNIIFFGKK